MVYYEEAQPRNSPAPSKAKPPGKLWPLLNGQVLLELELELLELELLGLLEARSLLRDD